MTEHNEIDPREVEQAFDTLAPQVKRAGYFLNPDTAFTKELIQGMLVNNQRYGYWACPCRLADGVRQEDLDIICPCYYRDADVLEHGACYCALYVSKEVIAGTRTVQAIPERRPPEAARKALADKPSPKVSADRLSYPVWRCQVCGYLCARDEPPEICPICHADQDRFEVFVAREEM